MNRTILSYNMRYNPLCIIREKAKIVKRFFCHTAEVTVLRSRLRKTMSDVAEYHVISLDKLKRT